MFPPLVECIPTAEAIPEQFEPQTARRTNLLALSATPGRHYLIITAI